MKNVFVIIITCTMVFQNSCTPSKGKEHKENNTKFLVSSTIKMDTTITEEYVCQINSIRHIELRAQEKGYLEHIYVDEGKFVRKGQLLFKIMPRIYEAELQKARAEADFANIEYQNTKSLADRKIVATNELAMAKARLDKANAEMALAQVHLDFTEIRAPFDGIIDRFHVREGSLVEEGELLTHLSDNSKMWVYYNVPEAEYLDFQSNLEKDSLMEVKLLMANNKMFGYSGVVETIEADFNNETGNIPFRATFPNPEGLLRHGETGNIRMAVPLQNALIIPQKATFEILDKKYVFVVDKDNRIKTREITIIAEMEDLYAIGYGLEEKEKILLEGLRKVKENEEITFDYKKPEAVIASLKLYAE